MKLVERKHVYEQKNDCCDRGEYGQFLEVFTQDGGGGPYLVIKTERWSLDESDIPLLCKMLKDAIRGVDQTVELPIYEHGEIDF